MREIGLGARRFDVASARNVVLGIGKVGPVLFGSSRERPAVGFMAGSRQAPGPLKVERELLRLSGDDGRDTAPPRRRRRTAVRFGCKIIGWFL